MTDDEPPIWSKNGVGLYWRPDCFGNFGRALFLNGLSVGSVLLWTGSQKEFMDRPWRAWIEDTNDDGSHLGWFKTEQEAKDACVDKAIALLGLE